MKLVLLLASCNNKYKSTLKLDLNQILVYGFAFHSIIDGKLALIPLHNLKIA